MKNVSQETADQVFHHCDIDKDNRVGLREFRTMLDIGNSHAKEIFPKGPGKSKSKTPKGLETSKGKETTKNQQKSANPIVNKGETKNKITKGCQQTDFEVWGPKVNTEFFEKKGIFKRRNSRERTKLTNTRSIPLNPSRSRTRLDGILLRSSTTKK